MAGATRIRQGKQARNSEVYDDTRANGSGMEGTPENLEQDLNNIRSQLRQIIGPAGKWFDDPLSNLAALSLGGGGGGSAVRYFSQPLIGPKNGTNLVYTTAAKFDRNGLTNECVYLNGIRLSEGVTEDYVASESTPSTGFDTITMAIAPRGTDKLVIDYNPVP